MIIFVQERPIEILPPVISLLRILKDLGEEVAYFGMIRTRTEIAILEELGVRYEIYPYELVSFRTNPFRRCWQKATQWIRPYLFRSWIWKRILRLSKSEDDVILWSSEMRTAAVLGNRALKFGKRHIQSLYELGDEAGKDYWGFDIDRLYATATLIECEYNRAHILKAEKGIDKLPFVLPNKPYAHPRRRAIPVSDTRAASVVESWKGKKVFLYQGGIQSDRGQLLRLIEALCESQPNAIVAIMGRSSPLLDELMREYANVSYVPFVPPPHHLEVTSHADVGIAYYQGGSVYGLSPLNPVYCAPNKIYEYSGFGLPLICNDIPGLKYTIEQSHAGVCLDDITKETVSLAVQKILSSYQEYSDNAQKFFDAVDLATEVKKILTYARS